MIECSELSDVINFIRYLFMTNRRWDADMEWVLLNAVMVSVVSENLLIIWNFASSFRYQHYLNDREAVKLFLVFHFNGIRIGHCLGHFRSRNLLIYVCFYVCSSAFPLGINLSRFWHELVQFYKYDFYQLLLIEVIINYSALENGACFKSPDILNIAPDSITTSCESSYISRLSICPSWILSSSEVFSLTSTSTSTSTW